MCNFIGRDEFDIDETTYQFKQNLGTYWYKVVFCFVTVIMVLNLQVVLQ